MVDRVQISGTRVITPTGGSTSVASLRNSVRLESTLTTVTGSIEIAGSTGTVIVQANAANVTNPYGEVYTPTDIYGTSAQRQAGAVFVAGGLGIEKDLNVGGYIYGRISHATSSQQLSITPTNTDATFYPIFSSDPANSAHIYSDNSGINGGLTYNPALGRLTVDQLVAAAPIPSISKSTGGMVVAGGLGVGGMVWTGQDISANTVRLGQGHIDRNNVIVQGTAVHIAAENMAGGRSNVVVGAGALAGLETAVQSVAIGHLALARGTNVSQTIAIGASALELVGTIPSVIVAQITSITQSSPVTIIAAAHGLSTGTQVIIADVHGMIELNNQTFYVLPLSANSLALYSDNIVQQPVNSAAYAAYTSGGSVSKVIISQNNIAVGTNAATALTDGLQNLFIGDNIAKHLSTGSYNIFLGHEVGNNITHGNGNISISGHNLVDGQDDQINIGSVFYYDGIDYLQLNADVGLGLGTASTSTTTGALVVLGGAAIQGDLHISGTLYQSGSLTPSGSTGLVIGGTDIDVTLDGDNNSHVNNTSTLETVTSRGSATSQVVNFTNTAASISAATGAVVIAGGAGIGGDVNVTGQVVAESVRIADSVFDSTMVSFNSTATVIVDSYSIAQYRTAKYLVQIDEGSGPSATFQAIEILLMVNNIGTVFATEYGILTSDGIMGEFAADVQSDNMVRLYFTPVTATAKTIKVLRTGITT